MDSGNSTEAQFTAPTALVLQLLAWLAERPRTYRETMDAWRTSCPRIPVWEDATMSGLVAVFQGDDGSREDIVCLTPEGRAFLAHRR